MKIFIEIEVEVEYDFHPSEQATSNYPGCEADVEVTGVMLGPLPNKNTSVDLSTFLDAKTMDSILNQCWIDELEKQVEQE